MTNKEAIIQLEIMATNLTGAICETNIEDIKKRIWTQIESLDMAIDSLKKVGWIPFLFDKDGYLCCKTPYENDEILVSSLDNVWQDTWVCTYDEYGNPIEGLESNIELVGLAWKPMPKPWGGR